MKRCSNIQASKVYEDEVKRHTNQDRGNQINELRRKLSELKDEETRLGRLLITKRITEESFDQLRLEWQEKLRHTELRFVGLEKDAQMHVDDLDMAIALLEQVERRFLRLEFKQRSTLLQILAKRITVSDDGKIIDYELNSPFAYLRSLADNHKPKNMLVGGSGTVRKGAQKVLLIERFFYS